MLRVCHRKRSVDHLIEFVCCCRRRHLARLCKDHMTDVGYLCTGMKSAFSCSKTLLHLISSPGNYTAKRPTFHTSNRIEKDPFQTYLKLINPRQDAQIRIRRRIQRQRVRRHQLRHQHPGTFPFQPAIRHLPTHCGRAITTTAETTPHPRAGTRLTATPITTPTTTVSQIIPNSPPPPRAKGQQSRMDFPKGARKAETPGKQEATITATPTDPPTTTTAMADPTTPPPEARTEPG